MHSSKFAIPGSIHWKVVLSPWFVGSILGLVIGCPICGGGFDAFFVFLTDTLRTVPPTVHLLLKPVALLGWPYSYACLVLLSALAIRFVKQYFGGRWWLAVFSAPVVWELWSGQIEWMVAVGIVLALLVLDNRIRPYWLGFAWILMISKPYVGIFAILALTYMAYRQFGWKPLLPAAGLASGIFFLTFLYRPAWYLTGAIWTPLTLITDHTTLPSNGAFFPWGLLAWSLVPGARNRTAVLRRILAAGLLSTPYLHLYHATVLTALTNERRMDVIMFITGWAIFSTGYLGLTWSSFSWIYPLTYLVVSKVLEEVQPAPARSLIPDS